MVKKRNIGFEIIQGRLRQTFIQSEKRGGFTPEQQISHDKIEQLLYDIGKTIDVRPRKGFRKKLWQNILAKLEQLEEEVGVKKES